ncbi:uncharacterized protein LOC127286684 [Leptopilina boulardi]|uniref:uncharacterized protein LOC127286684 n=1 Tax=Leptopilina boulardi TaxID=63433 RepID=UPI0021F51F44|nr:uncharacterized protein LOC127286684 [Leptopilina boulardi]
MEFSKEGRFFPNECYICKSMKNLNICKCNMISYCGENHRLQHYPIHEKFCNAVMELLNEKKVSHIYEELHPLLGTIWTKKQKQIYKELKTKLTRSLSTLEEAMFERPRVCYVCRHANQENLKNCLKCPIASFCMNHPNSEEHDKNCILMRKYLNMLQTADALNVNLQFLPTCYPFIRKNASITIDRLTFTMLLNFSDSEASALRRIESKIILLNFIDAASIFHTALQKIENINPLEIIIHLDALDYKHVIVEKNYWEFLLHLNSDIKILKIVITGSEDENNFKTSLCKECRSMKKNLSIERYSMPYEEYILQENYQKPTALFYCKFENNENFHITKKWINLTSPIILHLSRENFDKCKSILEFSSEKIEIIYEGEIHTLFNDKSIPRNDDYIIIFKSKGPDDFIKSEVDSSISGNNEINISDNANDSNATTVQNELLQENKTQDNSKTEEIEDINLCPEENQTNSLSHQNNSDSNQEISYEQNIDNDSQKSDDEIEVTETNFLEKHIIFLQTENNKLRQNLNLSKEMNTKLRKEMLDLEEKCSNNINENVIFRDENNRLREHLNLSVKRNLELQEISSKLVKKIKLIKEHTNIDDIEKKIS